MAKLTLLVIDDDPLALEAIRRIPLPEWNVVTLSGADDTRPPRFHAALVDLHLTPSTDDKSGLKLIEKLQKKDPHAELIAMSGDLRRENMESALKAGASRFLAKPIMPEELTSLMDKISAHWALQIARNRKSNDPVNWLGNSSASDTIRKSIAQLRGENGPILISGESGTGKEVVARLINAQDKDRVWVAINMAAIPENLFESELFGHNRGAFTGADQTKVGLIEAAHGGDLFLDEIEALPPALQPKLLRFLETGEFRRVGTNQDVHVDVRVIAATNENLEEKVKQGSFREDLYWRLSGKKINIPPLRDRKADIEAIAQSFLSNYKKRTLTLADDALAELKNHSWPGNVRELKRVLEQIALTAPMPIIRKDDLSLAPTHSYGSAGAFGRIDIKNGLSALLNEYEKNLIQYCNEQYPDPDSAARILKISRSSYYQKLKEHSLGSK